MSDLLETVIDKVSSYQIFNYLLPGAVFVSAFGHISGHKLMSDNLVVDIIIVYFTGLTLSRIGSLVVEPLCKKIKIICYSPYGDYLAAVKKDGTIPTLLQESNTYRTLTATFLALLIIKIALRLQAFIPSVNMHLSWVWPIALLVLFLLSYRKQTMYIVKRIKNAQS